MLVCDPVSVVCTAGAMMGAREVGAREGSTCRRERLRVSDTTERRDGGRVQHTESICIGCSERSTQSTGRLAHRRIAHNVAPVESLVNRSYVVTTVFSQNFRHIVRVTAMDVDPHGRTCRKKVER